METRVRYAPSPTGLQHIGSVRTALFNYLFARSQGGKFILRLEDTDRTRFSEEYVTNLYDTFKWLGFYWDEGPDRAGDYGPYIQSERFVLYREHAQKLVDSGHAYYCFCRDSSQDEEDNTGTDGQKAGKSWGYPGTCRKLPPEEAAMRAQNWEPHVIRLKIPLEETSIIDDILLGKIEWKNSDLNPDPVLLKTDGFPTYHLANVVDDHLMGITHIMRAQEWIPSAPLHLIMYKAFGWEAPRLCHLPMVLGNDGHKLSKRHGSTSVDEFRKQGYLPEALINYVAMLGASYEEDRDLYSIEELARLFDVKKINKAPAVFDYAKLEWFNGQYIRQKTLEELAGLVSPYLASAGLVSEEPTKDEKEKILGAMPIVRERLKYLSDAAQVMGFLFREPDDLPIEELIPKKLDAAVTKKSLEASLELLQKIDPGDHELADSEWRRVAGELGFKLGDMLMPLRMAVTGSRISPPLFESIHVLGRDIAIGRIKKSIQRLEGVL